MKRILLSCLLPIVMAAMTCTSCIFDSPQGDEFYRTLWKSEEVPLGPFKVSTLTLEFLCNDGVSIRLDNDFIISGTYKSDGTTATFTNLKAIFETDGRLKGDDEAISGDDSVSDAGQDQEITVTFIEAHRNGSTLFLLWRVQNAAYPFTTALNRVTDYEK